MTSKADLTRALHGVEGWFDEDEAWTLHEIVRRHSGSDESGPTVVEIGSWRGRSTIVLALALRARGSGVVYAIDPHRGTALHESEGVVDTYDDFLANIRGAGVAEFVRPIRSTSAAARPRFAARSVDVLLVDGAHGYHEVRRDIDDWSSALADAATIAFHDARAYTAVRQAVKDRVLRLNSPFRNPRLVDETLVIDFRRGAGGRLRGALSTARFRRTWTTCVDSKAV